MVSCHDGRSSFVSLLWLLFSFLVLSSIPGFPPRCLQPTVSPVRRRLRRVNRRGGRREKTPRWLPLLVARGSFFVRLLCCVVRLVRVFAISCPGLPPRCLQLTVNPCPAAAPASSSLAPHHIIIHGFVIVLVLALALGLALSLALGLGLCFRAI